MSITKIILVRHGEVAGNAGDKPAFVGWSDLPLNERGFAQARAVGEYLQTEKLHAVYSSDLQRAKLTAQSIAEKQALEVVVDRDLREVNYGKWEGLSEADLLQDYPSQWQSRQNDPWNVAAVEGENYAQMWQRFLPRWNAMLESHHGETFALVAHNGLLRMLLCHLVGAPFAHFKRFHIANGGVTRIEITRPPDDVERILIKAVNDISHLKT